MGRGRPGGDRRRARLASSLLDPQTRSSSSSLRALLEAPTTAKRSR